MGMMGRKEDPRLRNQGSKSWSSEFSSFFGDGGWSCGHLRGDTLDAASSMDKAADDHSGSG